MYVNAETVGSREDGGQELLVCGGKCRLSSCQLSFSSRKALEQHVEESQQLKCPYVSVLYLEWLGQVTLIIRWCELSV